jgi:hypothetical protein
MFAAKNAFEPAKKQLDLPAVPVECGNGFSRQVHAIGSKQQAVVRVGSAKCFFAGDSGFAACGRVTLMEHFNEPDGRGIVFACFFVS